MKNRIPSKNIGLLAVLPGIVRSVGCRLKKTDTAKHLTAILLSLTIILSFSGCAILPTSPDTAPSTTQNTAPSVQTKTEVTTASTASSPHYVTFFDPDETFADEPSRLAAEHIDPVIKQAVEILNTIPDNDIAIVNCDYGERPTEKDTLIGDEQALEWYDFIYEKLRNVEEFRLDPADYGGEEALNFPFFTAETALHSDHEEIFLCSAIWVEDDGIIHPIYFMPRGWVDEPVEDLNEVKNALAVYDGIVDRIFEKMPPNLNNYEKTYYFILVIALATDYNLNYQDSAFSPYDTLVLGHTVCHGYSKTFYELCRRAGISAWYCIGLDPNGAPHAWNRIDTTDGPLYIDITWYDKPELVDHYLQGLSAHLFMTQEDCDFEGYQEGVLPEDYLTTD